MWNQNRMINAEATSNLWVGNLAMDVTEADLRILFQRQGPVDSVTLYSARSYAFVSYKRLEDAMAAKDAFQGTVLRGYAIKIDFAKPARPSKSLWVGGIGPSVLMEDLEVEFLRFGKIEDLKFFRDRNTALVDYFTLEDASQALKVMNGARIGDGHIRVDFLRSNPSKREHGNDAKEGQSTSRNIGPLDSSWVPPDSKRQQQPLEGIEGDGQPSSVLCISYPPHVHIDEQMLHNAMILFGEIEGIRSVPLNHCSFVEFRSVEEACRAKEGLQGKLFNDPRILITYSASDVAPNSLYTGFHPGIQGPRPNMFPSEIPFTRNHSIIPNSLPAQLPMPMRAIGPTFEPLLPNPEFHNFGKLPNPNPNLPMEGSNLKRPAPPSAYLPSSHSSVPSPTIKSQTWDAFDTHQSQRESKRLRVEDPDDHGFGLNKKVHGVGPLVDDVAGDSRPPLVNLVNRSSIVSPSRARNGGESRDYVWRGLIAKGGTPVCRARCVPIGEGIQSEIPEVVNCTARTGLDLLTKHYAESAVGFEIIFFLPDSVEDFAHYTEFLRFLGAKNRAGVAKFDDGTTLFLVPPSDFLTKVLKVTGPERLYGVVLKFRHQPVPNSSAQSLSPPQHRYIDNRQQENFEPYQRSLGLPNSESVPTYTAQPTNTGLTLTPELIAALASVVTPKEKPPASTSTNPPVFSDRQQLSQGWQDHNTPELMGHHSVMQQSGSHQLQGWQDHNTPTELMGHHSVMQQSGSHQLQGWQDHNAPEPAAYHPMMQQSGSQQSPGWQNERIPPAPTDHYLMLQQSGSHQPPGSQNDYTPMAQQLGSPFNQKVHQVYQHYLPTPHEFSQGIEEIRDQSNFSSRPSNNYSSQSQSGQFGQYHHEGIKLDNNKSSYGGGDAFGLYSPSNPDKSSSYKNTTNQFSGANASSQLYSVNNTVDNANKSSLELPSQVQQQLQSALYGSGQSTSGPEVDKSELYKSTLQFAANLLLQVQQKQHAGQGSGNHQ